MSHPPASRRALSRPVTRPSRRSGSGRGSGRSELRRSEMRPQKASSPLLSPHRKKLLWAGGAITLLAMTTLLPTQVSSQAVAEANCEQVITSGAEISRGQLSSLLDIPTDTDKATVRQALSEPYCMLPAIAPEGTSKQNENAQTESNDPAAVNIVTEREAYPLAFDLEAWVVVNYQAGQYVGYDFVFKP